MLIVSVVKICKQCLQTASTSGDIVPYIHPLMGHIGPGSPGTVHALYHNALSAVAPGTFISGLQPTGSVLGDTTPESRDEAPVGVYRGRCGPEAEAVCRHCLQILTTYKIKIKVCHQSRAKVYSQSLAVTGGGIG